MANGKKLDKRPTKASLRSMRASKRHGKRPNVDDQVENNKKVPNIPNDAPKSSTSQEDQPGPSKQRTPPRNVAVTSTANRRLDQWFMAEKQIDSLTPVQLEVFDQIMCAFDDADGGHVIEIIRQENVVTEDDTVRVIDRMFGETGYRRRATVQASQTIAARRALLLDDERLDIDDLLKETPDPAAVYGDETKIASTIYRTHAVIYLQIEFNQLSRVLILQVLAQHGNRLTPTVLALRDALVENKSKKNNDKLAGMDFDGLHFATSPRKQIPWPSRFDEQFFRELQYIRNKTAIDEHKTRETARYHAAQLDGDVVACPICLEEDIPDAYMLDCKTPADDTHGHVICRQCLRQHASTQINEQGQVDKLSCAQPDCEREYTIEQLETVLSRSVISRLAARREASQLRKAGLTNVVECPFCDYFVEMIDNQDKVFKCRNPLCQRRSCILCRRADHVPLPCHSTTAEGIARQIEDCMAEAMIRTCPNKECGTRCIKDGGCNSMHCGKCKTEFCYVCNEKLEGFRSFTHFDEGRCEQFSNQHDLHEKTALRAGENARRQLIADNPDAAEVLQDVDMKKLVDNRSFVKYGFSSREEAIGRYGESLWERLERAGSRLDRAIDDDLDITPFFTGTGGVTQRVDAQRTVPADAPERDTVLTNSQTITLRAQVRLLHSASHRLRNAHQNATTSTIQREFHVLMEARDDAQRTYNDYRHHLLAGGVREQEIDRIYEDTYEGVQQDDHHNMLCLQHDGEDLIENEQERNLTDLASLVESIHAAIPSRTRNGNQVAATSRTSTAESNVTTQQHSNPLGMQGLEHVGQDVIETVFTDLRNGGDRTATNPNSDVGNVYRLRRPRMTPVRTRTAEPNTARASVVQTDPHDIQRQYDGVLAFVEATINDFENDSRRNATNEMEGLCAAIRSRRTARPAGNEVERTRTTTVEPNVKAEVYEERIRQLRNQVDALTDTMQLQRTEMERRQTEHAREIVRLSGRRQETTAGPSRSSQMVINVHVDVADMADMPQVRVLNANGEQWPNMGMGEHQVNGHKDKNGKKK